MHCIAMRLEDRLLSMQQCFLSKLDIIPDKLRGCPGCLCARKVTLHVCSTSVRNLCRCHVQLFLLCGFCYFRSLVSSRSRRGSCRGHCRVCIRNGTFHARVFCSNFNRISGLRPLHSSLLSICFSHGLPIAIQQVFAHTTCVCVASI